MGLLRHSDFVIGRRNCSVLPFRDIQPFSEISFCYEDPEKRADARILRARNANHANDIYFYYSSEHTINSKLRTQR